MSLNCNVNKDQNIPLYSQTSNDWGNKGESNYAVNLDVGINEYVFSRTTPNNDFIVSTGLVNDALGIKMVGGGKKLKNKESKPFKPVKKESKPVKPVKKESEEKKLNLTNKIKKFFKNSKDQIDKIVKKIVVKK